MRWPVAAVAAGVVVAAVGIVGLARGAVHLGSSGSGGPSSAAPIVVTGAFVRPTLPPNHITAAYFTVHNTTDHADVLESVVCGAGATSMLHLPGPHGSMVMATHGMTIPAHGSVTLAPDEGHVMIEGVYGWLRVGQSVNLDLQFRAAGDVAVVAPVVAYGQSPTGGGSAAAAPSSSSTPMSSMSMSTSGAHS